MTREQCKDQQREERSKYLQEILASTARRKLIVAGPGTGKTFTFAKLLEQSRGGNNLAMTFIRKLVEDMKAKLSDSAEVKTLHAYCKKILHAQEGKYELVPFLTKIIESDANLLGESLCDFDAKFRSLAEDSNEVVFYLNRGDYYGALGFDDSVYRLYKMVKDNADIVPSFSQIVIDEFQDFNPLEVAFISELAKKSQILIVGDDDQAVYDDRNASPTHLRRFYNSPDFAKFELPFCSRCPEVIVKATNCVIETACKSGHFSERISKRFECYLEDKEADSLRYPKIKLANCTTSRVVAKYVQQEIGRIVPEDIEESHNEADQYPTVLIVGMKQYLREIEICLRKSHSQVSYSPSNPVSYGITDAYDCLFRDLRSNLGWRILLELFFNITTLRQILKASRAGVPMIELIDEDFAACHLKALDMIRAIQSQERPSSSDKVELKKILGIYTEEMLAYFVPEAKGEEPEIDRTKPTILLTSYKGCKGLSAGHVFLVGFHNKSMPRNPTNIKDVEISQFVVALTRTRKQCHLVSNRWLNSPRDRVGRWIPPFHKSDFVSWIPKRLIKESGMLVAKDFN